MDRMKMTLGVEMEGEHVRVTMEESAPEFAPLALCYLSQVIKGEGRGGMAAMCARAMLQDKEDEVMAVLIRAIQCEEDMGNEVCEAETAIPGISEADSHCKKKRSNH